MAYGHVMACNSHTLLVLHVSDVETNIRINKIIQLLVHWGRASYYTGIPRNCVPVFKLGQMLVLFSRVKRHDWQRQ